MYDELLLPVDGSAAAAEVLHHASEIAHYMDATIRLLYVADTGEYSVTIAESGAIDGLVQHGREVVADAGKTLETLGVEYATDVVQGSPAETIVEYGSEYDYDLIVMPTQGRGGLSRYLLGSVTEKVVRLSSVPVLTARMDPSDTFVFPYERMLVPTDGSESARRAAEHALDLADALDATVHALSVIEMDTLGPDVRSTIASNEGEQAAEEAVDAVVSDARARGLEAVSHVERGSPDDAILDVIDAEGLHAVVMGTTGRRGVDRILLGSVAEKTVRSAPVPVITVRRESEQS
jgi:nucleotide-binding universal stress UspA family protein